MVAAQQSYESAATIAGAYSNNSKNDWFLPSKDELNELCKYARNTGQAAGPSASCSGGALMNGYSSEYWSSSESNINDAWWFELSAVYPDTYTKAGALGVRPIRAF